MKSVLLHRHTGYKEWIFYHMRSAFITVLSRMSPSWSVKHYKNYTTRFPVCVTHRYSGTQKHVMVTDPTQSIEFIERFESVGYLTDVVHSPLSVLVIYAMIHATLKCRWTLDIVLYWYHQDVSTAIGWVFTDHYGRVECKAGRYMFKAWVDGTHVYNSFRSALTVRFWWTHFLWVEILLARSGKRDWCSQNHQVMHELRFVSVNANG